MSDGYQDGKFFLVTTNSFLTCVGMKKQRSFLVHLKKPFFRTDFESDRFLYIDGRREESIIKGDAMMDGGSRMLVLSIYQYLEFLARRNFV